MIKKWIFPKRITKPFMLRKIHIMERNQQFIKNRYSTLIFVILEMQNGTTTIVFTMMTVFERIYPFKDNSLRIYLEEFLMELDIQSLLIKQGTPEW